MALILQNLHTIQWERSIDWRVRIPFLSAIEPELLTVFPDNRFYCTTVEFPTSDTMVVDDNLGVLGSYKSMKIVPDVRIEILSDGKLLLERALIKWSKLAYDEYGAMALPIHDFANQAVQHIDIERIDPTDIKSVVANLAAPLNIELPENVIRTHKFQGYLEQAPRYSGSGSADYRLLEAVIKVTNYINPV